MATLCLGDYPCSGPVLFDWLAGEWGLLFSHPGDFEFDGSENDRGLSSLRQEFHLRSVRPLACLRGSAPDTGVMLDRSWVSELLQDTQVVRLNAGHPSGGAHSAGKDAASEDPIELAARQLGGEIARLQSRFVLIIDGALQARAVLNYSAGRTSLSPLDLLGSVDSLRRRSFARRPIYSPNVTYSPTVPCSPGTFAVA